MKAFSPDVSSRLKHYVYILVDPRTNEIFYVGKGSSDRVFEHEKHIDGSLKGRRIQEIRENGYEAKKYIVHAGMSEKEAFAAETAIYNLCNAGGGLKCSMLFNDLVPCNLLIPCADVAEAEKLLSSTSLEIKDFDPKDKIMMVNIYTSSIKTAITDESYHEYIRKMASVSAEEDKPDHILSIARGIVVGAYDILGWVEEQYEKKFAGKTTTHIRYIPDDIIRNSDLENKYKWSNVEHIIARTSNIYKLRLFKSSMTI